MSLRLFHSQNKSSGSITSPAGNDPTDLTWNKIHEERYYTQIDESHIHYTSDFSVGVSTLTAVTGSSPSVSGGNLVIPDTCIYKSTANPVASWATAEMTISSMGTGGSSQKLGPALVKDSSNYIACVYDSIANKVQIIENGTILKDFTKTLNATGLKIWCVLQKNGISMWTQESGGGIVFQAHSTTGSLTTYTINNNGANYKYGVYCSQGSSSTHNVSSLRGGACGGVGIYNNRVVAHEDGSPYYQSGKLLMTGDLAVLSTLGASAYTTLNSCLFALDLTDYSLEIIGRYYFNRNSQTLGGADIKLYYRDSLSEWVMTYVPVDDGGTLEANDYYIDGLTDADIFTERIILNAELKSFNLASSNIYDVNARLIGSTWYMIVTNGFGAGRPRLYSGTQIDNMTTSQDFNDGVFLELTCWARLNNAWFYLYYTFNIQPRAFTHPFMGDLGNVALPNISTGGRIPGFDWFVKQGGGISEYFLIGFDVQEVSLSDAGGNGLSFEWTLGRLVVWQANETSNGYEFN